MTGGGKVLSDADWERLAELRAGFLGARERAPGDYWRSPRDLEIYDATFGERIRWKWNAVLAEVARRRIALSEGVLVDWGAGTGVATRAFLAHFGAAGRGVAFVERSPLARDHARRAVSAEFATATLVERAPAAADVLLASHVLSELDEGGLADLVAAMRAARMVIWVEAGDRETARELSRVRDALLDTHDPLLPCPHRERCGVLAPGRERDWCHHFAPPAPEAFTTAHWRSFSRRLSIDLRALPVAFLVLAARDPGRAYDPARRRILGRPRFTKGRALLALCGPEGVGDVPLLERTDRAWFRDLEKGTAAPDALVPGQGQGPVRPARPEWPDPG